MKKKLSCLLLALSMLAGMTACGDGSASVNTDSNTDYNITLTMWLPTSEDTTAAAIAQVESAINKITKKNLNIALDITAIPEDEYDEAIRDRVLEVEEAEQLSAEAEASRKKAEKDAKKRGETLPTSAVETTTEPPVVTDEEGEVQEHYPAATANQLDIFCIRGYDNFTFYAENGYLSPLGENLDASSKLLKSYIYPTFLEWASLQGDEAVYAIPNNHVIGEYTYMLINKELCDDLHYDPTQMTALIDTQEFIETVGAYAAKNNLDVTPLLSSYWLPNMSFWNSTGDRDAFSVLGTIISDESSPSTRHNIRNVFGLKQFTNVVTMMKELDEQGYIAKDASKVDEFGVGIISCDASEIGQYQDKYYTNVIQKPRAETADVYQSMFGVSLYSLDVDRAMDIITLINTDPTVRTILQYGVEGTHWEYNEELTENDEQTIKIISDEYKMNLVDTGNVFMTYPGENIPMSYWEYGKQQNLDSIISPFLSFNEFPGVLEDASEEDKSDYEKYLQYFADLEAFSADILKRVEAMSAEEFKEALEDLKDEVADNMAVNGLTDPDDPTTLSSRYIAFHGVVFPGTLVQ